MSRAATLDPLALASAASAGTSGPTLYDSLESFPEFVDTDDCSRTFAARRSDGMLFVIAARGVHAGLIGAHNTRAELTHALNKARAAVADAETAEDAEALESASVRFAELDAEIKALPFKTRAQPTLDVARALQHYSK